MRSHPFSGQLHGEHTDGTTPSQINSLGSIQVEPPLPDQLHGEHTNRNSPSQINSLGSIQVEPPLPDQLPGEYTDGNTPSQINSLESIQEEPPSLRSTPWRAYRWNHPSQINSLGSIQEPPPQINSLESIQVEPLPLRSTPSGAYRTRVAYLGYIVQCSESIWNAHIPPIIIIHQALNLLTHGGMEGSVNLPAVGLKLATFHKIGMMYLYLVALKNFQLLITIFAPIFMA